MKHADQNADPGPVTAGLSEPELATLAARMRHCQWSAGSREYIAEQRAHTFAIKSARPGHANAYTAEPFKLDAGRLITYNGARLATLHKCDGVSPTVADALADECVRGLNLRHAQLNAEPTGRDVSQWWDSPGMLAEAALELLALIQSDRPAALAINEAAAPRIAELVRDVQALAEREAAFAQAVARANRRGSDRITADAGRAMMAAAFPGLAEAAEAGKSLEAEVFDARAHDGLTEETQG